MKPRYKTSRQFERHYQTRIAKYEQLIDAYLTSVAAFFEDPASVKDHSLAEPMRDRRAFWITNEYRVIYRVKGNEIVFVDIGTHEQVYQR